MMSIKRLYGEIWWYSWGGYIEIGAIIWVWGGFRFQWGGYTKTWGSYIGMMRLYLVWGSYIVSFGQACTRPAPLGSSKKKRCVIHTNQNLLKHALLFDRPCVAEAVLQTPSSLIHWLSDPFLQNLQNTVYPKASEMGRMFNPPYNKLPKKLKGGDECGNLFIQRENIKQTILNNFQI